MKLDKEKLFSKWLPLTLAGAIVISLIIFLPQLFIGLILGWVLCKNRDKIQEFERSLDSLLEEDGTPD